MREAVEQPASSLGVRFADGLVDLIIRDVGQEPGSLPLLEFCLTQLWERQEFREINHDAYKAIGGVQQALANHADAVYAEFTESERERLRHIFLKLVRPGQGTEDTRQVARLEQIRAEDRALVTRLADKRLLVTGRDEERGEETVEVVHEALIRRWQTLRQWVDEEREFLVWQEKLQVLLGQWEESEKDEGALLRGLPLDEALKWQGTHDVHLADGEREFVETSGQLQEKEQQAKKRRGQYLVIGLVGAIILAVLAGVFGLEARQERRHALEQKGIAEEKAAEAKKQTLVANYNLAKAFEEKALTALKVAKEKGDIGKYKEAILFTSVAMNQPTENNNNTLAPSSIINFFLSSNIFGAALSERWSSPKQIENIKSISFHPTGTLLAATAGKNIQLWDCISGKETIVLEGHTDLVTSIAFSPDGKTLASTSRDETVRIWNYATGEELMVLQVHTNSTRRDPDSFSTKPDGRVIFNPDGVHVASSSIDDSMMLWNIESGELVKNFYWYYRLYDIAFSPDGQVLALVRSGGFMKHIIELWDYNTGSPIDETIVSVHHPGNGTGRIEYPASISFSSVGGLFAVTSNQTILLWNFLTGKQIDLQHTAEVQDISFQTS
ncbi:MAG: hypothetical protein D3911_16015 [Candidatus Electrothrix sp. AW3_4]|nr:hypothetical protein [Candidatus Electrothrix gigas]